jgi:protoporphyrinogen oxidase
MQAKEDIHIIGAGISGLIAAYELEQTGYKPTIIEKSYGVGGRVKTINEDGLALDLGFQVLLSAYPMANKYLDMDQLKLTKLESGALVYADGKSYLIGDPLRNWKVLVPTLMADIGSINDKLKILKLNLKVKNKSLEEIFNSPETTTQEYLVDFGFSPRIIGRFFKPFFAGIFLEPDLKTSSRMFEFVYKMFGEGYACIPKLGIGEISKQLKSKLKNTNFIFNTEVEKVTSTDIITSSGEQIPHKGVIVTNNASSIIDGHKAPVISWKECMCLYFEVDKTNIPGGTIGLVTETDSYSNNLYAYKDTSTGKNILSITTLQHNNKSDEEIIEKVIEEIKKYTGASQVSYIQNYRIKQALPDIGNLSLTAKPKEIEVRENVFLAGDYLLNGSLNAAMESGKLAAQGIIGK